MCCVSARLANQSRSQFPSASVPDRPDLKRVIKNSCVSRSGRRDDKRWIRQRRRSLEKCIYTNLLSFSTNTSRLWVKTVSKKKNNTIFPTSSHISPSPHSRGVNMNWSYWMHILQRWLWNLIPISKIHLRAALRYLRDARQRRQQQQHHRRQRATNPTDNLTGEECRSLTCDRQIFVGVCASFRKNPLLKSRDKGLTFDPWLSKSIFFFLFQVAFCFGWECCLITSLTFGTCCL